MRPALHMAFDVFAPQIAIGELLRIALPLVGAPRDRFGAPQMRKMIKPAIPGPDAGGAFEEGRLHGADILDLRQIVGLQHAEFLELRGAIARRLHEVETFAAGRLKFVDLLFILRERRRIDLDAGRLLEIWNDVARKLVRPVEEIEFAG